MRVLLTRPYSDFDEGLLFPLGLCRVAGALSQHEVSVFDPLVADEPYAALARAVAEFNPDIVGISFRNVDSPRADIMVYLDLLRRLIATAKGVKPDVTIMVGGTGFSMFAREIMDRVSEIDYGVFLEGERSVPELLANLDTPHRVRGLFYRREGRVCFTGTGEHVDLSSIPRLKWDLFPPDRYLGYPDAVGIDTKRGCTERCAYCNYPYLSGNVLRLRPPRTVVDEIEHLLASTTVKRIMFADNVFDKPREHAEAICREILERGISLEWTAWFSLKYITRELMELAVEAGCVEFAFSPDAYGNRVLEILKKDITSRDILKTYRLARAIPGARVSYNFLLNPPGQNLFSFAQLLLFYLRAKLGLGKKLAGFYFWHPIRIFPHTELARIALKEGVITSDTDLSLPVFYWNPRAPYVDTLHRGLQRVKRILSSRGRRGTGKRPR